jgi:DNA-binding protein HU-beta
MTKADLVDAIALNTMVQQATVEKVIDAFIAESGKALSNKQPIYLRGFGTFKIVTRKAKPVRNIRKGENYITPPKDVVKFKASRKLC